MDFTMGNILKALAFGILLIVLFCMNIIVFKSVFNWFLAWANSQPLGGNGNIIVVIVSAMAEVSELAVLRRFVSDLVSKLFGE